jgi:two-component system phosphate regulon sensor histidine kinase PhoR
MWIAIPLSALLVVVGLLLRRTILLNRDLRVLERILDSFASEEMPDETVASFCSKQFVERIATRLERLVWRHEFLRDRIRHEEFSLNTILSSMEEGVIVADAKQVVRLANSAFIEKFGLTSSPVDRSILEVLGEVAVHRLLLDVLETGQAREEQLEMLPGRKVRVATVRAVPMSDSKGRPGVLAVFRDVTRLHELETVRRDFVSNVSHELRTPLAIFQGYVETLIEMPKMKAEERVGLYQILRRHSLRLNALVEDLLTIARLESKREVFNWQSGDVGEFVAVWTRDWRARIRGHEVDLQTEIPSKLPPVRLDPFRMEQVLHNLLENAFKHLPSEGGVIMVRVEPSPAGGAIRVTVQDNGSGIAPNDLPHIFERFFRADKARTASAAGAKTHSTGLGLSIVKHIIVEHGGHVGAESSQRGAQVWFELPLEVSEPRT